MSQLRAPFPYFGGKSRIAAAVWQRFGDVPNYVEPFFGSGAVLLARPHAAKIETVNDADAFLCNFWRAVSADPEAVAAYADWPVSEPDLHARHLWLVNEGRQHVERLTTDPDYFDAKIAGWWVWGICQWIGSGWCAFHEVRKTRGTNAENWNVRPDLSSGGRGVHSKRPHLMTAGKGVTLARAPSRQLPHVGGSGRGVHALLSDGGTGVHRKMPEIGSERGIRNTAFRADLVGMFRSLQERLRRVRWCCGDWSRVMGPSVTVKNGLTAVFLDPPYSHAERDGQIYAQDHDVGAAVRKWALENGDDPLLRIALCGYDGEHAMPASWSALRWKAAGGYGSQGEGRGRANASREVVWFSPHCLNPQRMLPLFDDEPVTSDLGDLDEEAA